MPVRIFKLGFSRRMFPMSAMLAVSAFGAQKEKTYPLVLVCKTALREGLKRPQVVIEFEYFEVWT